MEKNDAVKQKLPKILAIFIFIAIVGAISGFSVARLETLVSGKKSGVGGGEKQVEQKAGIENKKIFKDTAEGVLKTGGIEGEGTHYLARKGGKSQNVYLTSSAVDLSEYIGMKVRVRGETFKAEKAGWLMDVGLVEVIK